jgi:hypothetical protein
MRTKACRVALPISAASSGSRRASERSGESRWISAACTKRYGAMALSRYGRLLSLVQPACRPAGTALRVYTRQGPPPSSPRSHSRQRACVRSQAQCRPPAAALPGRAGGDWCAHRSQVRCVCAGCRRMPHAFHQAVPRGTRGAASSGARRPRSVRQRGSAADSRPRAPERAAASGNVLILQHHPGPAPANLQRRVSPAMPATSGRPWRGRA